jgi:glycogen synthase
MNLLFVIPSYLPVVGGAQTFARAMSLRLVADGHQVTVLTANVRSPDELWRPANGDALPQEEVIEGVRIVRLPVRYPAPAPYRFGILRRAGHWLGRSPLPGALQLILLRQWARSMPPLADLQSTLARLVADATLVQAFDATWDGLFTAAGDMAQVTGKPFVATPLLHTGSAHILAHFTMAHQLATYRQAAAVIVLSQSERELLQSYGVTRERLFQLSMGIDRSGIDTSLENVNLPLLAELRDRYNFKQPFVAFLGAATYDKGAFTLVEALLELNRRGTTVDLVCAGPQQEQLQRFIQQIRPHADRLLVQRHVHLLGIVYEPAKQAMLAASTLLALPSRVDSFGIALLEAWQHGKPVVAAAEGGLVETVAHGENGLLVPFGNVKALADALESLLQDPGFAQQLGAKGRSTVTTRYRWDQTYETLLELYAQIQRPV